MLLNNNLTGFAHIGIQVYNIDETSNWYVENLGFKVINESTLNLPDGTIEIKFLELNNIILELFQLFGEDRENIKGKDEGLLDYLGIYCENVDSLYKKMMKNSVMIETSPQMIDGTKAFNVLSANGEKIRFIEELNKNTKNNSLAYIKLYVKNLNDSLKFYKMFGFTEKKDLKVEDKTILIEYDCLVIKLVEDENIASKRSRGKIDHFALRVKDHNLAYQELVSNNIDLLDNAPVFQESVWEQGVYYFISQGPSGEAVEFNHKLIDDK